jgi:hypothetical protein
MRHLETDMRYFLGGFVLVFAAACSSGAVDVGGFSSTSGAGGAGGAGGGNDASTSASTGESTGSSTGESTGTGPFSKANVIIHLRASTAPVPHPDGFSGQTPSAQSIGIRKLTLFKSVNDPSPFVAFDHAADAVEAGLNDKDDTVVATVPAKSLPSGIFTIARVAISHVRYRIAATMHGFGQTVPGNFQNLHVLSDGSKVDGATWNKGHYSFSFLLGTMPLGTQAGENGPLPPTLSGGGITFDTSGPESAYVFPVSLPVSPDLADDVNLVFEINTHENFRWQDEQAPEYKDGVFDATPTTFEAVKSFGANSFELSIDPTL